MNLRIMIIEDDDMMRSLLRTLLQMEGYDVVPVPEAEYLHTAEIAAREMPDLIFMDVHLGQVSGFDLLAAIRQNEKTQHIFVLMCSGMELSTECIQQGADAFILKPFLPDNLLLTIRRVLQLELD